MIGKKIAVFMIGVLVLFIVAHINKIESNKNIKNEK
jgi:hypothetical protein